MEARINIGYRQVSELVGQLSDRDIHKLMKQIQAKFANHNTKRAPIRDLILQAPTWTDEEYYSYLEMRNHINQTRLNDTFRHLHSDRYVS